MKTKNLFLVIFILSSIFSFAETPTEFIKRWASDFNKNEPKVISKFYENSEELEMLVSVGMWHHWFNEMLEAYKSEANSKSLKYYDSKIQKLRVRTPVCSLVTFTAFRMNIDSEACKLTIRPTQSGWDLE